VLNIRIRKLFQQNQEQKESLLGKVFEQLRITSIFWKGTGICKRFDPFTISWADEGEALEEFCLFMKRELYPILGPLFKVGKYAAYKEEAILDVLIYILFMQTQPYPFFVG